MEAVIERFGGIGIVELSYERIDVECADQFKRDIAPVLCEPGAQLIFDMYRVEAVDSAGIGAIISCVRKMARRGGNLKLCNLARPVRSLFTVMRLHTLIDILDSPADAVRAFQAS